MKANFFQLLLCHYKQLTLGLKLRLPVCFNFTNYSNVLKYSFFIFNFWLSVSL